MKKMNKDFIAAAMVVSICAVVISCKYDVKDLGPKPDASFTIAPVAGQVNKYVLTSTSLNSFRYDWDKANGAGYVKGNSIDTVYFPDAGTYTIKLLAYGQSGMDSASQQLVVAADDPAALTPFKMLTGNSSRKWKLAPEPGALFIGPPDFSQTWWASGLGDITSRSCLFNDEYTFTKTGSVLTYDSKGDFYVDEEGGQPHPAGMPAVGCYANSAIPVQFQPWANSGNFTFEVIGNTKLKINGLGAHLGLYKAGTTNAALPAPESSVTYDIVSITPTRLVIKLDYGWGAWRFTYVAM